MATNYSCATYSGVELHIIRTDAQNIKPVNLMNTTRTSMENTNYYGVNGGFFNMSGDNRTLNIALENGNVVGPYLNNYSNGFGNSVGSGAIYWNGSQLMTTYSVEYADQLSIYGDSGTWAQGGIGLWLGYNDWENQFKSQKNADAYFDRESQKTAIVADMSRNLVYLVVTEDIVSTADFRVALQAYLGISDGAQANNTYQALLLDGSGSSQMRARSSNGSIVNIKGDSRNLSQIITLRSWS